MYCRMVKLKFKDGLTRKALLSYLQPIIQQQAEAYGLISMTTSQIAENTTVTSFLWPDYETAMEASEGYGAKITDGFRNAGTQVEVLEGPVQMAWFNADTEFLNLNTEET